MADPTAQVEFARLQLVNSLNTVTESLRNAAAMTEQFANMFKYPGVAQGINASNPHVIQTTNIKRKAEVLDGDAIIVKDGRKRKARKPKDPNEPKRPPSTYLLFQNDVRKGLKAKHPNATNSELLAMISKMWQEMPDADKSKYTDAHATAKEKYDAEKAAYEAGNPAPAPVPVPAPVPAPVPVPAPEAAAPTKKAKRPKTAPSPPPTVKAVVEQSSSDSSHDTSRSESEETSEESSEEEEPQPATKKTKQVPAPPTKGKKGKQASKD